MSKEQAWEKYSKNREWDLITFQLKRKAFIDGWDAAKKDSGSKMAQKTAGLIMVTSAAKITNEIVNQALDEIHCGGCKCQTKKKRG